MPATVVPSAKAAGEQSPALRQLEERMAKTVRLGALAAVGGRLSGSRLADVNGGGGAASGDRKCSCFVMGSSWRTFLLRNLLCIALGADAGPGSSFRGGQWRRQSGPKEAVDDEENRAA